MSSYSARDAKRRGSVVPPLAGVEKPGIEVIPETCDVLICGTGLTESILAAALAWQGTSVLHIDSNPFYGDATSCLNPTELQSWIANVANNPLHPTGMEARFYLPRALDTNKHLLDLAPHLLFAKSDMLDLLLKSRVFQYLEFKPLTQFHTYQEDSFEKVAGNKEAIFTDQSLSSSTKRNLMRFVRFVLEWEIDEATYQSLKQINAVDFLREKFLLEPAQISELVFAIGLCDDQHISAARALSRIRRYLLSLDVYGPFPVLYSMYGSAGELSQAFCRSAAVAGATYKLGVSIKSFDETSNIATLSDGSRVQVSEKVLISPTQKTELRKMPHIKNAPKTTSRLVAVVSNECNEWFKENESSAIVVFPPGSLGENMEAVHTIVYGPGSGYVPAGYSAWYLRTNEQDTAVAKRNLDEALAKLEKSILRESSTEFELGDISQDEMVQRPDGSYVISSVRLGESMQKFVPRNKLQYLAKLQYTQPNSVKTCGPTNLPGSNVVSLTPYQPNEISYDGFVAQARRLYESIVGSDEDFFDVDFEDENEEPVSEPVSSPDEAIMHEMEL